MSELNEQFGRWNACGLWLPGKSGRFEPSVVSSEIQAREMAALGISVKSWAIKDYA